MNSRCHHPLLSPQDLALRQINTMLHAFIVLQLCAIHSLQEWKHSCKNQCFIFSLLPIKSTYNIKRFMHWKLKSLFFFPQSHALRTLSVFLLFATQIKSMYLMWQLSAAGYLQTLNMVLCSSFKKSTILSWREYFPLEITVRTLCDLREVKNCVIWCCGV